LILKELHDIEGEAKACHFLGYAHYCLGNYREAVRYYDQDLSLAKDLQDKMNMGRAYCNLGLAHLALGNLETSLECQKYFLGNFFKNPKVICYYNYNLFFSHITYDEKSSSKTPCFRQYWRYTY